MPFLHVALVYNASPPATPESGDDLGSSRDLRRFIRRTARVLRRVGYRVTVVPLAGDLMGFLRRLRNLQPDVVLNQYDDVVHGALYEMRVAALVRMLGFPMTGSPAIALGVSRYKYMTACILQGAGIPIPAETTLIERVTDVRQRRWRFPLIVQASQEHAGIGLDRDSVVHTKRSLEAKCRQILREFKQPALVQQFIAGREFHVPLLGSRRIRILPLAEVDYSELPDHIPPILSYAAKWIESSIEYRKTPIRCPAEVEPSLADVIGQTAVRAFRAVGGLGYGRVDIRLDEENVPRVLDVNCNCSIDEDSVLARAARAAALTYPKLLQTIIKAAFEAVPFDVEVPMLQPPVLKTHPVNRPV